MAEAREQINPKVRATTKALLLTYCQDKHTTQGDVVDAAVMAFLQPKTEDDLGMLQMDLLRSMEDSLRILAAKFAQLEVIEAKQDSLEQGVAALMPLLTTMVERLEQPQPEPEPPPPPPIADYSQLYKELRAGAGSAEDDADSLEQPEDGNFSAAPAVVAPEVVAPPPERRGWFFTRRTAP
jgi:hypothetical protein